MLPGDSTGVSRETLPSHVLRDVFHAKADAARAYREILATKGLEWGLLGPREVDRLWSRHILNCAAVAELLAEGDVVVDVGSGAGLPGIPLALASASIRVLLLEPSERRTRFLMEVVDQLGLAERVRVVRGRAEDADLGGEATVAVARAVAPLRRLVPLTAPLVGRGGRLLAMKGRHADAELRDARQALRKTSVASTRICHVGARYLDPPATVVELRLPDR